MLFNTRGEINAKSSDSTIMLRVLIAHRAILMKVKVAVLEGKVSIINHKKITHESNRAGITAFNVSFILQIQSFRLK